MQLKQKFDVCFSDQYDNIVYDCTQPRHQPPGLNNNLNGGATANLQLINNLNKDKLNKNMEADKLGAATSCAGESSTEATSSGKNVNMNIKGEKMYSDADGQSV